MAKKRKATRAPAAPAGAREYDPKDARLGPITTFADVADEQEEYFLDRDKILFDDEPGSKRQRMQEQEEAFLELSDEEVLGGGGGEDSDSASEEDRKKAKKAKKAKAKAKKVAATAASREEDEEVEGLAADDNDDEGDQGWWGTSRKEYYDGEAIETEDNAREEEEEARRLQKKQLARMTAADFFDMDEWTGGEKEGGEGGGGGGGGDAVETGPDRRVVTVTMKTAEEISKMTREEQYRHLQALYPELDHLCDEFAALEPRLAAYRALAAGKPSATLEVVQFHALSCYLATIALYFSLLMAPTRDQPAGPRRLMDPDELHDHEVMAYLVDCRQTWEWVQRVQARRAAAEAKKAAAEVVAVHGALTATKTKAEKTKAETDEVPAKTDEAPAKAPAKTPKASKKRSAVGAVSKEVEASLADLSALLAKPAKKKAAAAATAAAAPAAAAAPVEDSAADDSHSDLGEEEVLDARTADEKLKRKKTLGFYTSQIMQKANLRSRTGGAAASSAAAGGQGDVDIPYRERLRDRQARLNAAAARRGQAAPAPGDELGGDDEEEGGEGGQDANGADAANDPDDSLQYYNRVVRAHKDKMDAKAARKAAAEADRLSRVVPDSSADADGRRQLTWAIAANKGLSHRTLKEKKNNPRVKKRLKFEKKKKQLASMRAVYKPVDRDNYQGERTGIKTGLVRSIKLS